MSTEKLYNITEASQVWNCSPWTARAHVKAGHLQVTRIGRLVKVSQQEVDRVCREGLPSLGKQR